MKWLSSIIHNFSSLITVHVLVSKEHAYIWYDNMITFIILNYRHTWYIGLSGWLLYSFPKSNHLCRRGHRIIFFMWITFSVEKSNKKQCFIQYTQLIKKYRRCKTAILFSDMPLHKSLIHRHSYDVIKFTGQWKIHIFIFLYKIKQNITNRNTGMIV